MQIRHANLREIVLVCEAICERASRSSPSTFRSYYSTNFFEKSTSHARSMLMLVDVFHSKKRSIDISGVCALSRCILEVHNASAYLLELGLSKNEQDLRFQLLELNRATDLRKIYAGLGAKEGGSGDSLQEFFRTSTLRDLKGNPVFLALDEPHQKSLLRGKTPYLIARYAGKRPLPRPIESAAYNLFSHSVHSFSLGISPMHAGSATPVGAANMLFLAVEIARIYLSCMAINFWRSRSRAIGSLLDTERDWLANGISTEYLEEWLSKTHINGY